MKYKGITVIEVIVSLTIVAILGLIVLGCIANVERLERSLEHGEVVDRVSTSNTISGMHTPKNRRNDKNDRTSNISCIGIDLCVCGGGVAVLRCTYHTP